MFLNNLLSDELRKLEELKKLRIILKLDDRLFDHAVSEVWHTLQLMKLELGLQNQIPIDELVRIFNTFQEIRMVFNLKANDYIELNELLVEITAVKGMLNLPDAIPLPEILSQIKPEQLSSLGIGKDSLLEKMMLYSWFK
ncbi:MAG: hypothetical protein ACXADY_04650 [Candidatus Hodarchaeales archaeon]|jgi:hypothetical protein